MEQFKQWQPTVRLVDRPTVDVNPRPEAIGVMRDGQVVGQRYDYGADRREQSFYILIDGAVGGRLEQCVDAGSASTGPTFAWRPTEAVGPINFLARRQWEDPAEGFSDLLAWPSVAIAALRAALEAE